MPNDLNSKIALAQNSLNKAFGIEEGQEGKGANRFLNKEALATAYKEEASTQIIIKQFLSIAKSVRNMRSSYLPIEFFKDNDSGVFTADVESNISKMESYENTFMRMMGMPSVGLSEFGLSEQDSEIRSSETLMVVDPLTQKVSTKSMEEVTELILNQRKITRKLRRISIDNSIYNISESTALELAGETISLGGLSNEEIANLLLQNYDPETDQILDSSGNQVNTPSILMKDSSGTGYLNPFGGTVSSSSVNSILTNTANEELKVNIANIESDLWKFSYLLIPPIQSVEISGCINEPSKVVAAPFSNQRARVINNNKTRPTLLESIIRIRLDRVSGTDTFIDGESSEVTADSYGVLESLFILRLRSAISGLASKLYSDIDTIIDEIEKSKRRPVSEDPENGNDIGDESNEAANQFVTTEKEDPNSITEIPLNSLQQQKLIEDSILFLLGDNSEVLNLQSQTQRNSSIHDSHMMSGLISIIDVPRKRIEFEVDKIIQSKNDCASNCIERKIQEIGVVLGTDIGIGTLDVTVFALALFSISESSLLGLLSTSQFEKIKNGEFRSLLPGDGDKRDSIISINELSQLIIDGYNLFITDLKTTTPPN